MTYAKSAFSRLFVLSVSVLLTTQALARDEVSTQVDIPYEMFQLDNGLTVIVHGDHATPTVFVGMWYGVGSKDEPEGKTGFAHLFEHLMFNGSENVDTDYFEVLEPLGATDLNGTTNMDRTNYFQNVPTSAVDLALWTALASIRARGNTLLESKVITAAALLNLALDPVLIFGLLGAPALGVQGAAIASGLAFSTGALVLAGLRKGRIERGWFTANGNALGQFVKPIVDRIGGQRVDRCSQ